MQSPDAVALAWERGHIFSQECCNTELFKQQGGKNGSYVQPAELLMKPEPCPTPDFSELFSQKQNKNNPHKLEDPYSKVIQPRTTEDWIALLASEGHTLTAQSHL